MRRGMGRAVPDQGVGGDVIVNRVQRSGSTVSRTQRAVGAPYTSTRRKVLTVEPEARW